MTTPKQRRIRRSKERDPIPTGEVLLDQDFDADEANREFVRFRWPERDDGQ